MVLKHMPIDFRDKCLQRRIKVRNEFRKYLPMYDNINDIIDTALELIELEKQSPILYKKAMDNIKYDYYKNYQPDWSA